MQSHRDSPAWAPRGAASMPMLPIPSTASSMLRAASSGRGLELCAKQGGLVQWRERWPTGTCVEEEYPVDLLTKVDLEQLAESGRPELHLSLFIPTHPSGVDVQTDPIRWKNLVSRVEQTLVEQGLAATEIADLLTPAWQLRDDHLAWRYMSDGLAMFLRPGWHRMFRVPVDVPEVASIGDRFVIGPLLPLVTGDTHFLALTVSQRQVRLLEGSMQRVEEVELPEVPTALEEVVEAPESRSDTMTFPVASGSRGGGTAVFYGHGGADEEFKQNQVRSFLRQVSDGLRDYLAGQDLPMVLVGLDEMVATYRDLGGYAHVLEDAVLRNPDELSAEELHTLTWPLAEKIVAQERAEAVAQFEQLHGTGQAVTSPTKIEEAARTGRVGTLFVATEPSCWDQPGSNVAVVQLGRDEAFAHCELLDRVAVASLSTGARVHAVPAGDVPGEGDIAAVFRY